MNSPQQIVVTIKNLLKNKNISVKELLNNCNLSINTLSSMSSRGSYPNIDTISKIALELECSVDYLIGLSDIEKTETNITPQEQELLNIFEEVPEDKKDLFIGLLKSQAELFKQ